MEKTAWKLNTMGENYKLYFEQRKAMTLFVMQCLLHDFVFS